MPKYREEHVKLDIKKLQIFASRIKELREERELSQEALDNFLGYSRSAISSYETAVRNPDLTTFLAYSRFFDVSIDYLVGETNVRKTLYRVACASNISDKDVGKLSDKAKDEIANYIQYVVAREKQEEGKK